MQKLKFAGWALAAALMTAAFPALAQQDDVPILRPKSQTTKSTSATLLVTCDLACNWKLDGEAKGHIDAGGSAKAKVELGQHLVVATIHDGLDKVEKELDIETVKQTLVRIELAPAHDARLKAEQEARDKAAQEARDRAAQVKAEQEARDKAAQEARDRAAQVKAEQEARDKAVQEARDKAAQEARDKASHEQQEELQPVSGATITIKDPAEYNAYQNAITQYDPRAKAATLERFLQAYPRSVVKSAVLDLLIDTYQSQNDGDHTLSAASRLLQVDPNNMKAIFISVFLKKAQCGRTSDAQACDDAAALARKGLLAPKPAGTSNADWKKLTAGTYPAFHSAIAFDLAVSKKDFQAAITEYTTELMLYTDAQTQSGPGLQDTLLLAKAYSQPGAVDLVKSIWFYARAWNFAPASYKPTIEKSLEYYYWKFHGGLDGLDDIKAQSALTTFPPRTLVIPAAKTAAEFAHDALVGGDPARLNLGDKEFILANGVKEDADKMWAVLKDQVTPVPGKVIEATASVIKVAVTADAKDANVADFIVKMKKPLADKKIPAVGYEYKIPPATALVGTYDSFTTVPATDTTAATAQIVLRDGEILFEK